VKGGRDMDNKGKFLLYTANDGAVKVEVFFKDENVWLTQKALAELFGVQVPAINKHLKNIFESEELSEEAVISILETTATGGKNDSAGYRNRRRPVCPIIVHEPSSPMPERKGMV
jgi:hypothetical protein